MLTLPNMSIQLPVPGSDFGTWGATVNADLSLLDAHDHSAGKGARVTVDGLSINKDLPVGGFGLTSVGRVAFSAVAPLATGTKTLFISNADNELYYRTNAGVNVKLTNGASINTSLVGGIVGDYAAVGAEVAFDNANKRYTFKDQSSPTKKWVRMASGPVRIYEHQTTETVYVEHAVDAALAAPYTVTWPTGTPAGASLVQISAAGNISFSPTLPATTVIKHASMQLTTPLLSSTATALAGSVSSGVSGDLSYTQIAASSTILFQIAGFRPGDRITSVVVQISSSGGVPTPLIGALNGTTFTPYVSTQSVSVIDYTVTVTTPAAMIAGDSLMLKITNTAGGAVQALKLTVNYDRP